MPRSLQLRVSLFLLPVMLFKSPERPVRKPRRVLRWVERVEFEGTEDNREFRDPICLSVTSLIDGSEVEAAVEVEATEVDVRSAVVLVTRRVVSEAATVLGTVVVGAAVVGTALVAGPVVT